MNKLNEIARFISEHDAVSNNEISKKLHLSMPTVLQYTRILKDQGVILETGKYDSTGGRKASAFSISETLAYVVGVEVKRGSVIFTLVNVRRKLMATKQYSVSFTNAPGYFRSISQALESFLKECKIPSSKIAGIGISLPGIVDREKNLMLRSHALGVQNMSFGDLSRWIDYPYTIENDANCAAFAELRGFVKNAVYISLNDTVGGAVFLNGSLYRGDGFKSGEFGHMVLENNGKICYCGKRGCMDSYCSAIILKKAGGGSLSSFFEMLKAGDARAEEVWESYVHYLALSVTNLRMAFDCTVVLGGEVGGWLEEFFLPFAEKVKEFNNFDIDTDYLRVGKYKSEASSFGATLRFIDKYFENML